MAGFFLVLTVVFFAAIPFTFAKDTPGAIQARKIVLIGAIISLVLLLIVIFATSPSSSSTKCSSCGNYVSYTRRVGSHKLCSSCYNKVVDVYKGFN